MAFSFTSPKTWVSALVAIADLNNFVSALFTELQNALTGTTANNTGLSISVTSPFAVTSYRFRNSAGVVFGVVTGTLGGSLAGAAGTGNTTDTNCFTLPTGYTMDTTSWGGSSEFVTCYNQTQGFPVFSRINTSNVVLIGSTLPSQTIASTDVLVFTIKGPSA